MNSNLSLQFASAEHKALLTRARVKRWVIAALENAECEGAELTIRFVDETEGRALNKEFRGKDYATNVLTFDYAREPVLMADIVLCSAVVAREAAEQDKELIAHYAHLIMHGVLHARGYDHEKAKEAKVMEALEISLMKALGFANPY